MTLNPSANEAAGTALEIADLTVVSTARRVRTTKALAFALSVFVVLVVSAILAPYVSPHDPLVNDLPAALTPPAFLEGGDLTHIMGTDRFGRDVLTRVLYGLRVSLSIAAIGTLVMSVIGIPLGILAGYFRGGLDALILRGIDIIMALPALLIALVIGMTFGPSLVNVVVIIMLSQIGAIVLPVRADVLALRERGFVRLARTANAGNFYIIRRHIFPHVRDTCLVLLTLLVGQIILLEAALSFLGVGIPPPDPSLGGMVSEGLAYLGRGWWISVFPGVILTFIVLAANVTGDWLRDYWDPRLRT